MLHYQVCDTCCFCWTVSSQSCWDIELWLLTSSLVGDQMVTDSTCSLRCCTMVLGIIRNGPRLRNVEYLMIHGYLIWQQFRAQPHLDIYSPQITFACSSMSFSWSYCVPIIDNLWMMTRLRGISEGSARIIFAVSVIWSPLREWQDRISSYLFLLKNKQDCVVSIFCRCNGKTVKFYQQSRAETCCCWQDVKRGEFWKYLCWQEDDRGL